jgi:hypothetical protein
MAARNLPVGMPCAGGRLLGRANVYPNLPGAGAWMPRGRGISVRLGVSPRLRLRLLAAAWLMMMAVGPGAAASWVYDQGAARDPPSSWRPVDRCQWFKYDPSTGSWSRGSVPVAPN